jgi:hypothetical protein
VEDLVAGLEFEAEELKVDQPVVVQHTPNHMEITKNQNIRRKKIMVISQ